MRRARTLFSAVHACCLALTLSACAKTVEREPTAVVVAIDAEPMVRAAIDSVVVEIASGSSKNELEMRASERFDLSEGARWPLTLTLLPKTAGADVFRIWVRAQNGDEDVSELRVISGFAAQRVLLLEVILPDECIGFLGCDEDETCAIDEDQGVALCADAEVPVVSLVPFTKDVIDRLHGDAGEPDPDAGDGDSSVPHDDAGEPVPDGGGEPEPDGSVDPTDPERCDNGDDDDGDGDIDCADDDCDPKFACAPRGEQQAMLLIDTNEACPDGFEDDVIVWNELLHGDSCNGCGCTAEQAEGCTAPIYFYASNEECSAAGTGTYVGNATSDCGNPIGAEEDPASPFGWRVGDIVPVTRASCAANGRPELVAPRWRRSRKLCRAGSAMPAGGGCSAGMACLPRVETESGELCALLPAGDPCVGGSGDDWYEGFDDKRNCSACSCTTQGGSCDDVTARLGSDYVCDVSFPQLATEGERQCFGGSSIYYPPADVIGEPTAATCSAASSANGRIDLLGGNRICCGN